MRIGDKILIRDRVVYFYGYEYEPVYGVTWVQFSERPDVRRQLLTEIIERWKVCESATVLHTVLRRPFP